MSFNVLGLLSFGYNPSACIVKDGELVAFCEEERLNRIKTSFNHFPIQSIRFCLRQAGLTLEDVHCLAVPWDCGKYPARMAAVYEEGWSRWGDKGAETRQWEEMTLRTFDPRNFEKRLEEGFRKGGLQAPLPEVRYVPHHLSHAASAFFPSPYEEAAVLTMDGSGEENCCVIWKGRGADLEKLHEINIPNSLGWYYSTFTQLLGFNPNMDEGKLMGLAPYGRPTPSLRKNLERVLRPAPAGYETDPFFTFYGPHAPGKGFSRRVAETFGPPREPGEPLTDDHRNLAYEVQDGLERIAVDLARRALSLASSRNLCLAGGVCLNCKMNGVILRTARPEGLFIQPVSSDAGSVIGAALWAHRQTAGVRPAYRMRDAYLGPSYSEDAVEATLRRFKLRYERHPDRIEEVTAGLLAKGQLIGWFQGRMEGGPRALGGRSILADPRKAEMKDRVNAEVKRREAWRPFCPSVTEEDNARYFEDAREAPFMILALQVREEFASRIPAVLHVDGSARPQTVSQRSNPRYWKLLRQFEAESGLPILLNTSFNIQGEPIVCSPEDAVRSFYSTGLDALVLGEFLLRK